MTIYVIVDINGKKHEITADNYDIKDGLLKFYSNGDICDIFVMDNVISITFDSREFVSTDEMITYYAMSDSEELKKELYSDNIPEHKSCTTCKYNSKKLTDEPCMTCSPWCNKWEAKDDKATL